MAPAGCAAGARPPGRYPNRATPGAPRNVGRRGTGPPPPPPAPAPPRGACRARRRAARPPVRGGGAGGLGVAAGGGAAAVPDPLAGGCVLLDERRDAALSPIPSDRENAAMNAGYVVQWWAFALLPLAGFGWAARREALGPDRFDPDADLTEAPVSPAV